MSSRPRERLRTTAVLAAAAVLVAASASGATPAVHASPPAPDAGRKVMIIAEENHGYEQVIGSPHAPYLNRLAADYGTAVNYDAGYPARCPSLAAYILMTSGSTAGICDDKDPKAHPLSGDNLFHQVTASGRQWRDYAEAEPAPCALTSRGRYLVRHVPAAYYLDVRQACRKWAVPISALHGALPAFSFVSPDACHDMHGASGCSGDLIGAGDRWLQNWLPQIMAGPDYRAGRLTIIVTWDEGTSTSNHIPTLVMSSTIRHVAAGQPLNHCSTLRFTEEQLGLPLLGCAAVARSLGPSFGFR
ncbi:MAG TPA: alkaline phosphatase family protein [Actinoplanes sp.]